MKTDLLKFLRYPIHASPLRLLESGRPQTVLVDFSSPNIAKPFHLGHFRATVTGNFIRNVNEAMHHRVIAINYLGDWGTQFSLLAGAFSRYGSWDKLNADPMRHLQEIYVRANADAAASTSPLDSANGSPIMDTDQTNWWLRVRALTIAHLKQTYARMNVSFTAFEYESDFVDAAKQLVDKMQATGLAVYDRLHRRSQALIDPDDPEFASDGVVIFQRGSDGPAQPRISLLKSNGSTLYLTRDVAAALSRYDRYHFDRIHYVVEDGQRLHFQQLCTVLQGLNCSWLNDQIRTNSSESGLPKPSSQFHVPFGRVQGVSTRRGQGLTLPDILDTARDIILQRMASSPNSRLPNPNDPTLCETERQTALDVADHLGVTCLAVEILRQRRQRPVRLYSFFGRPVTKQGTTDGGETLAANHEDTTDLSGLGLQYCHARLCSLERRAIEAGLLPIDPTQPDAPDLISLCERIERLDEALWTENQMQRMLLHLAGFETALRTAYEEYEAAILVQFASKLTSEVNVAWRQLPVLSCQDPNALLLRLAAFLAARNVLAVCLRLLGIRPLCKI